MYAGHARCIPFFFSEMFIANPPGRFNVNVNIHTAVIEAGGTVYRQPLIHWIRFGQDLESYQTLPQN